MSSGLAGTYFTLLQQFDQKAIPEPTGDNTQIQKVAAPTDSVQLSDTSLVTTTVQTPPFKYGVAKYGQAQYGSTYKDVILADNPVAYYRLDETAKPEVLDWSGHGNNGTISGGVTLGQPGAIADGDTAMGFDGVSGEITLPSTLSISGSFSAEVWVNPSSVNVAGMLGSRSSNPGYSFDMKLQNGNTIHGDIGDGATWLSTIADATFSYTPGTWCHIVYVVHVGSFTIFANGVQVAGGGLASGTPLLCDTGHVIEIGNDGTSVAEYFSGVIDEVAIYNYALSADQVQRHYNAAAWQ